MTMVSKLRKRKGLVLAAGVIPALLVLGGCTATNGEGEEPDAGADACANYPDGDIEFVVPYSAGGGFDVWARVIAPELSEALPGSPAIPVINRGGGGGLVGTSEVYNTPADGHTIVINEPAALATPQISGVTDLDFTQMQTIGRVTVGPEVIVVAADSDYETIEDVQDEAADRTLLMATGGVAAINIIPFDTLGIGFETVEHEGSSESLLSLVRGDTDVSIFPLSSVAEGIRGGDLRPLVVVGTVPGDENPDADVVEGVPTFDEVTGEEGIGAALEQHRMIMVAPGTEQCAVDILSDALETVFSDADFRSAVEEAGLVAAHLDAAESQEIYDSTFDLLLGSEDLLREHLGE